MKKNLTWILIVAVFFAYAASTLRTKKDKSAFRLQDFASIPVVLGGRIQPLDSVARNSLLIIRNNTSVPLEGNTLDGRWGSFEELEAQGEKFFTERKWYQFTKHPKKLAPIEWLLEVGTKPELADQRYIFAINHPDLKSKYKLDEQGLDRSGLTYYRYADLGTNRESIMQDARAAGAKKSEERDQYEKAVNNLANSMVIYERLKNSFQPESTHNFAADLVEYQKLTESGRQAMMEQQAGQEFDETVFNKFFQFARVYAFMGEMAYPLIIPPPSGDHDRDHWQNVGSALLETARTDKIHPVVPIFAGMTTGYQNSKAADFNAAVVDYKNWMQQQGFEQELRKGRSELYFNNFAPFKTSIAIYIFAFLLIVAYLIVPSPTLWNASFALVGLSFIIHSSGLIFRMVLEGRPPVTNLYSSAVFIGWGTVVIGMIIERVWKNGLGLLVSSFIGVVTLIIAHNLSLGGDTMEMLQAVLDTNIWLATHVVVITLGYSAMFLAGLFGIVYLFLGVFTQKLTENVSGGSTPLHKAIAKIVFGIVCFATLFSFVGTVLGGIWADQSWGRFWGWDPKENGALLIVLWCAVILHARLGGLIREKGLMVCAIFGNIITAFSWFGVNMLGIGLHSYGFMDAAFKWLMIFNATQLFCIALAFIPQEYWRSQLPGLGKAKTPGASGKARPKTA